MFKKSLIDESILLNDIKHLLQTLFPICRSITGNGVRESLSIMKLITSFNINEYPSGMQCYDWVIPDEWNVTDAYITDSSGKKIVDFKQNNLHLVSYSIPFDGWMTYEELIPHLHTLPNLPNAIPYRTTYYDRNWGFCISYDDFLKLEKNKKYHVHIKSTITPGSLTYGEYALNGKSECEFLFSSYCCHPSLANDNLSGMILWILLLRELKKRELNHKFRFVLVPETIGAIAYLFNNEKTMKNMVGGYILTCVAGPAQFSYKPSFLENHFVDTIVDETFKELQINYKKYEFDVNGSDESHYSAPFFRIPIGTICRDKYYDFDYYHTSLDNLDFIKPESILQTLKVYLSVISKLDSLSPHDISQKITAFNKKTQKAKYKSIMPFCEPMLSKRGLYPTLGGQIEQKALDFSKKHRIRKYYLNKNEIKLTGEQIDAIGWIMFYSDGKTTIEEISAKSGIKKDLLEQMALILVEHELLEM